ncbi:MAG: efflux RND transporter periplasmic adaptor subunit [Gemmatimonadetes bacterium]|nr:efflux RND transporter periplasmic adaptor subunit [Gemmatimonadota bacterium]MYG85498.1 efflux RND transporter periplasmic adaptor subunit [Gemmatimonadota bacterium]MYJ88239.1 efflux RND transporter periplasmic adaptor subunit [Gemmatimonadota bacterium]
MGFVKQTGRGASRLLVFLWLAATVAVAPAAMLAGCGDPESTGTSESGETAQVQLWTCGMHPNVIAEEPGQCPICGMNLTPLKRTAEADELAAGDEAADDQAPAADAGRETEMEHEHADDEMSAASTDESTGTSGGAAIVIDPVTIQNIGVQTATVQERRLTRSIRTVGHLDYNEEMFSRINVKYAGWIEKLYVNETGQQVAGGDPMLDIYSPELVAAQEEYLLAFQNVKNLENSTFENITRGAESLLDASKRRLLYWDVTEAQIRELEERGTIARTMTIHAPSKGIVVERMAELGMRVTPGMDMYRMADLSTIWAFAHVYDADAPWLSPGLAAEMELPYNPGKVYRGTIDYIYPYLDRASRDIKIRLVFPNRSLELKPQMYANIRLSTRSVRPVLVIPGSAVIHSGERNVVFIALEGGRFEPREVILGMEGEGGYVQAASGVRAGDRVVTSAQFLIDSESRLQEAIQKMLDHRMMH